MSSGRGFRKPGDPALVGGDGRPGTAVLPAIEDEGSQQRRGGWSGSVRRYPRSGPSKGASGKATLLPVRSVLTQPELSAVFLIRLYPWDDTHTVQVGAGGTLISGDDRVGERHRPSAKSGDRRAVVGGGVTAEGGGRDRQRAIVAGDAAAVAGGGELPLRVEVRIFTWPPVLQMPPPVSPAELPLSEEVMTANSPPLKIPPPNSTAELLTECGVVTVNSPPLEMLPPRPPEFPLRVEPVIVNVPLLVLFAAARVGGAVAEDGVGDRHRHHHYR